MQITSGSKTIKKSLVGTSKSTPINVERNLKKVVRLLRKSVKRQFDEMYKKKHYYWSDDKLRMRTLKFFTELSAYEIPLEFYMKNEQVFFKLIHNTIDELNLTDNTDGMKHMPITELFKDVFG